MRGYVSINTDFFRESRVLFYCWLYVYVLYVYSFYVVCMLLCVILLFKNCMPYLMAVGSKRIQSTQCIWNVNANRRGTVQTDQLPQFSVLHMFIYVHSLFRNHPSQVIVGLRFNPFVNIVVEEGGNHVPCDWSALAFNVTSATLNVQYSLYIHFESGKGGNVFILNIFR